MNTKNHPHPPRTLTPFGFQAEERTLWQAPEVYAKMAPFNNADKLKKPILLIHGEQDNNTVRRPYFVMAYVFFNLDSKTSVRRDASPGGGTGNPFFGISERSRFPINARRILFRIRMWCRHFLADYIPKTKKSSVRPRI